MATTLFPLQYLRQGALPIDVDSVFQTTAERIAYLANGRRYPGQVVADNEDNKVYVLNSTGDAWIELGSGGAIPAGNTGDVQWNNSGSMGADSGFTFDESTAAVGLSKLANSTSTDVQVQVDLGPKAWYVKYGDGLLDAENQYNSAVAVDGEGNIYTVGGTGGASSSAFIIKLSKNGQLIWQKNIGELQATSLYGEAIELADDGSIYAGIRISNGVSSDYRLTILAKFNTSGTLLWSRELSYTADPYPKQEIGIVGIGTYSGGVYCLVRYVDPIQNAIKTALCKYNSSGDLLWKYTVGDSSSSFYTPLGLSVDSTGNCYVSTQLFGLTAYATVVLKIDSSGTLVWNTAHDANPTFPAPPPPSPPPPPPPPPPCLPIVLDTFSGPAGPLSGHVGEVGAVWSSYPVPYYPAGGNIGDYEIDGSGNLVSNTYSDPGSIAPSGALTTGLPQTIRMEFLYTAPATGPYTGFLATDATKSYTMNWFITGSYFGIDVYKTENANTITLGYFYLPYEPNVLHNLTIVCTVTDKIFYFDGSMVLIINDSSFNVGPPWITLRDSFSGDPVGSPTVKISRFEVVPCAEFPLISTPPDIAIPLPCPSYLQCVPAPGLTNVINNVAWYTIETTETINLTINTEGSTLDVDTEVGLYTSTGDLLDYDDDGGTDYFSYLTYYNLAPGTYYIGVGYYNTYWGEANFIATSTAPLNDDCQIKLNIAPTVDQYSSVVDIDTAGNVYAALPNPDLAVAKLNSAGSLLWCSKLSGPAPFTPTGLVVDVDGSIFLASILNTGVNADLHITKWNSSGALEWQRLFAGVAEDAALFSWGTKNISLDSECYVLSGYTKSPSSSTSEALVVRLPKDGTITGSYSNFTYTATTYATSTSTPTLVVDNPIIETNTFVNNTGNAVVTDATKGINYTYMFGGSALWIFSSNGDLNFNDWTLTGLDGGVGGVLQTDGTGSSSWTPYYLPLADGSTGNILTTDGTGSLTWQVASTVQGGTGAIQFNDGGAFGGESTLTLSGSTTTTENLNVNTKLDAGYITNVYNPLIANSGNINIEINQPTQITPRMWVNEIGANESYPYAYPKAVKFDGFGNLYAVFNLSTTYGDTLVRFNNSNIYTNGEILWKTNLNLNTYDLAINSVGEIFVTGTRGSSTNIFLMIVQPNNGVVGWETSIPATLEYNHTITLCKSGFDDIVLAYSDNPTIDTTKTLYVRKMDRFGNILWQKSSNLSTSFPDMLCSNVTADGSGNVILSLIDSTIASNNIGFIKFDSAGNMLWAKKYTAPSNRIGGHTVLVDTDPAGNIFWAATEYPPIGSSTGGTFVYGKFDPNGNLQFNKQLGSYSTTAVPPYYLYGLRVSAAGAMYLSGTALSDNNRNVAAVIGVNESGGILNQRMFSSSSGYIYQGTNTAQEEGNLLDIYEAGNQIAIIGKSISAGIETPNNIWQAGVIGVFNRVQPPYDTTSMGGYEWGPLYSSGWTDVAFTLNNTTVSPLFTNTGFSSAMTPGITYPVNVVNNLFQHQHPIWIYQADGSTTVAMEYILPMGSSPLLRVLTMGNRGLTSWQTPAVASLTYSYTWNGEQTFTTNGIEVATLMQISQTIATDVDGYTNASLAVNTASAVYYTLPATGNWSTTFTGVANRIDVNQTSTFWVLVTQGANAYYNKDVWIDGDIITDVSWLNTRPLAGNPNSIDIYQYDITRLTTTPATYKVVAAQYKYVPQPPNTYWFTRNPLTSESGRYVGYSVNRDSTGNVYILGQHITNPPSPFVAKHDSQGVCLWMKKIQPFTGNTATDFKSAIDSSGNFVVITARSSTPLTLIIKFDPNGDIIWQKTLNQSYSGLFCAQDGSILLTRKDTLTSAIIKYNSSGTIVWQTGFDSNQDFIDIKLDSTGNIYVTGSNRLLKLNSSGSILWQKITTFPFVTNFTCSAYSSAGYIYMATSSGYIYKVDTDTGTLIYSRLLTPGPPLANSLNIDTDSSGNVYFLYASQFLLGPGPIGQTLGTDVGKIDSSGILVWANRITPRASPFGRTQFGLYGIQYDEALNSIYATGSFYAWQNTETNRFCLLKMPDNGSGINYYNFGIPSWECDIGINYGIAFYGVTLTWDNLTAAISTSSVTDTVSTYTVSNVTTDEQIREIIPTF